jgi:hypothetical protein
VARLRRFVDADRFRCFFLTGAKADSSEVATFAAPPSQRCIVARPATVSAKSRACPCAYGTGSSNRTVICFAGAGRLAPLERDRTRERVWLQGRGEELLADLLRAVCTPTRARLRDDLTHASPPFVREEGASDGVDMEGAVCDGRSTWVASVERFWRLRYGNDIQHMTRTSRLLCTRFNERRMHSMHGTTARPTKFPRTVGS